MNDFKNMTNLGEKIKEIRIQKGWSLDELSNRSGVAKTTIWGIEKGSQTSYDKLRKIANAFEIDLNDLILIGMSDIGNTLTKKLDDLMTIDKIKNMMAGEYGVDGVALYFLFHDIVKEKFHFDFETLSIKEQDEILSAMYFSIELKLKEILEKRKKLNLNKKNQKDNNKSEYTLAAHDDNLDSQTKKKNLEKAKEIFKEMDKENK